MHVDVVKTKLRYLSHRLRQLSSNPKYSHLRLVSGCNKKPYLKFDDFSITFRSSSREYVMLFPDGDWARIGRVPTRRSSFEKQYVDKAIDALELHYRKWMRGKSFKGSLYIRDYIAEPNAI
jgi:hypothetical protein